MFGRPCGPAPTEDWDPVAWEDPSSLSADPRSLVLDAVCPVPCSASADTFLCGDGGYTPACGASFSGGVHAFGAPGAYFDSSREAVAPVSARMPMRYGFEAASVHTAELAALVASLRWRQLGGWNMYVGDRSAVFHVMHKCLGSPLHALLKSPDLPMVGRLWRLLWQLWRGGPQVHHLRRGAFPNSPTRPCGRCAARTRTSPAGTRGCREWS